MSRSKEAPPVIDPNQRWLTVSEAAVYLHLSNQTIRNLLHSGELRSCHFGNTFRIDRTDLDEMMLRRGSTTSASLVTTPLTSSRANTTR